MDNSIQVHLEHFVVVVDDFRGRTRDSDEGDALHVGRQLDGALSWNGVARVEDGGAGEGAEHGLII